MFGIGGSELIFIILIAVMLFGADKIPEIARTLGKGMAQLKNATEDIKTEITKSAEENGLDMKSLTAGISEEIKDVKQGFNKMVSDITPEDPLNIKSISQDINSEISQVKTNIEDIPEGPIKRQS
ncbi:MAG: twin-arginine translocase TatA/TatE family subunit [Flavobacterium sp.]